MRLLNPTIVSRAIFMDWKVELSVNIVRQLAMIYRVPSSGSLRDVAPVSGDHNT